MWSTRVLLSNRQAKYAQNSVKRPSSVVKQFGFYVTPERSAIGERLMRPQFYGRNVGHLTEKEMQLKEKRAPKYELKSKIIGQEFRSLVEPSSLKKPPPHSDPEVQAERKKRVKEAKHRLALLMGSKQATVDEQQWRPTNVNWSARGKRYSPLKDIPDPVEPRSKRRDTQSVPRSLRQALLEGQASLDMESWMGRLDDAQNAAPFMVQRSQRVVRDHRYHIDNTNRDGRIQNTNILRMNVQATGREIRRRVTNLPNEMRPKPYESGPLILDKEVNLEKRTAVISKSRRFMKHELPTGLAHEPGKLF